MRSFAIFLAFWGPAAEAWFSSLHPNHPASRRTSLLASPPVHEESITTMLSNQQQPTSRRQWLMEATSTGMGLWAWSSPASAASLTATATLCDPTVSIWERNGRTIYLLGTAHISSSSAQLAGKLVQETHPDAVFVELDLKRIGGSGTMAQRMAESNSQGVSISNTDNPDSKPTRLMVSPVGRTETAESSSSSSSSSSSAVALATDTTTTSTAVASSPVRVQEINNSNNNSKPKQNGFLSGLGAAVVGKGIKSMYEKLGNEGFQPGEEFIVAIREGQKLGSTVVLGDQDVDVTLRRMAQAIRETDLGRLINPDSELEQSMREMLPAGADSSSTKSIPNSASELTEYVEVIKTKENVQKIMALLKNEAPAIYQVMVSERDAYMAAGLNTLNEFAIITAVMGLAHVDGVESNLQRDGWKPVPLRCRQPV